MKDNLFIRFYINKSHDYDLDGPFTSLIFKDDKIVADKLNKEAVVIAKWNRRLHEWASINLEYHYAKVEVVVE